jgi:hypothetical protein
VRRIFNKLWLLLGGKYFSVPVKKPEHRMEYIAMSAIWVDDRQEHGNQPRNIKTGYVACGLRHNHCWGAKSAMTGLGPSEVHTESWDILNVSTTEGYSRPIQGFVTSKNLFLTREESAPIAYKAGQIPSWRPGDSLASEELY